MKKKGELNKSKWENSLETILTHDVQFSGHLSIENSISFKHSLLLHFIVVFFFLRYCSVLLLVLPILFRTLSQHACVTPNARQQQQQQQQHLGHYGLLSTYFCSVHRDIPKIKYGQQQVKRKKQMSLLP